MEINKELLTEAQKLYFDEMECLAKSTDERVIDTFIIEKQKTYNYIRLYIREEIELTAGDTIKLKFQEEVLDTTFVSYAKQGMEKEKVLDFDDILNYEPEDNKKCLCLAIDVDTINDNSENIQFIRSLFKWSKHFDYQILKRDELLFSTDTIEKIDYFDIEF